MVAVAVVVVVVVGGGGAGDGTAAAAAKGVHGVVVVSGSCSAADAASLFGD